MMFSAIGRCGGELIASLSEYLMPTIDKWMSVYAIISDSVKSRAVIILHYETISLGCISMLAVVTCRCKKKKKKEIDQKRRRKGEKLNSKR